MATDHHHHHRRPSIRGILTKMSSIGGFSSSSPSQNGTQFEPLRYRVALMGRGRVGKTALLKRFLFDQFPEKYRETVEDLHTKTFDVNGLLVQADFLDTAGNIAFPAMRRLNISTAQAFILVYKLEPEMVSFEELRRIFEEIVEIRGIGETMRIPIVIVENQIDLENENGAAPMSPLDNTFCNSVVFERDAVFRNGSLSQRPSNNSGRSSAAGSRSASTSDGSSGNCTIDYCSRRNSASREVEEFLLSKSFEYKVSFVRSSAKLNLNVRVIFEQIAKLSGLLAPRSPNGCAYNEPVAYPAVGELDDAFRDISLHFNNGQGSKMKKQPPPSAISKLEAVANKAKRRFSLQSHSTLSHIPSAVLNEAGRLVDRMSSDERRETTTTTPTRVAAFHYSPAHHVVAANANGSKILPHAAAGPRRRQSEREAAAAQQQAAAAQPTAATTAAGGDGGKDKDKDRKGSLPAGQQQRKGSVVASLFGGKKSKSKSGEYLNAQECYVQ